MAILGCLLEILLEPFVLLLCWVVLLPVLLLLLTPPVLIASLIGPGSYGCRVRGRYAAVIQWWGGLLQVL